jgi:hypothetical protein
MVAYAADPLAHGKASARWGTLMLEHGWRGRAWRTGG